MRCNRGKDSAKDLQAVLLFNGHEVKSELKQLAAGDTASINLNEALPHPQLWSAEHPYLYPFSVELRDDKGTVVEHFDYHLGVKKVEEGGGCR